MDFLILVKNSILIIIKIIFVIVPLLIGVAYFTFFERRIIGYIHDRSPNRVGPKDFLRPIADVIKLLFKEIIIPNKANKLLFIITPIITLVPFLLAWAVIPFSNNFVISDINIGLLYILSMTSLGVYGVIIAGWATNSKYAFLGSIRSAAQTISYEIAMGFALVGVLMAAGTMNLKEIVNAQQGGVFSWYFIPLFPLFIIYWIAAVVQTNRAPFDVAEGESEIVKGFHLEHFGTSFGVFLFVEYANMILVSILAVIMFFGGWLSPFESYFPSGIICILLKTMVFMFSFLWFRATFPRCRYDQIMSLGWKIFIPITLIWIFILIIFIGLKLPPWFNGI